MEHDDKDQFNRIAEFKDRALEDRYFLKHIDASRNILAALAAVIGVVYVGFAVFDLMLDHRDHPIPYDLIIRGVMFLFSCFMVWFSKEGKNIRMIAAAFSLYGTLAVIGYQLILLINHNISFVDQALAFIIIMFGGFLIPIRWLYSLLNGIGIIVLFFTVSPLYLQIEPYQYLGAFTYFILALLMAAFFSYKLNVHRRMQYARERQLKLLSRTDHLTNIYNRQMFDKTFAQWVKKTDIGGECFSVVLFDLDDFKHINDERGHLTGDRVLVECAETVAKHLRSDDIFSRWGGEEFIILLPCTQLNTAADIAERLRQMIERHFERTGLNITASFGVGQYRTGDTAKTIIQRVDARLYMAKARGKNCICAE
ncbi:MAG: GGDEF domain-containing protein [Christensenellales bacterium]|jgi:two-component system cell cycle response regulator